jgi:uncharacterized protein YjbI with pentapeptide repeats
MTEPSGPETRRITELELRSILDQHKTFFDRNPGGRRADLTRADLRGANLSKASLCKAVMWGANLGQARMNGADLTGCIGLSAG